MRVTPRFMITFPATQVSKHGGAIIKILLKYVKANPVKLMKDKLILDEFIMFAVIGGLIIISSIDVILYRRNNFKKKLLLYYLIELY